ncbi:MAG: ThiF family adenylyltransferase [Candidatus Sedimenticola endophacoides]
MSGIEPGGYEYRFGGLFRLYGKTVMEALRRARVLVVVLGGVGSWAGKVLARSGVGRLTPVGWADVCLSNANRQVHALSKQKISVSAPG